VAQWLSGFLHGSGQLLFHYPPLWGLVNDWVANLAWEDFENILPLLRRTFADFSQFDRQRLLTLAREEVGEQKNDISVTAEKATPFAMRIPSEVGAAAGAKEVEVPGNKPSATVSGEALVKALLEWIG
jgi:hypothetical protein